MHPTPRLCVRLAMEVVVTRMLCFTQRIGGQYVTPVHFSFHPSSPISRRQPGQPSVTRARKSPYRSRQGFILVLHSQHPTPPPCVRLAMEVVVTRMLCFTQRIGGQYVTPVHFSFHPSSSISRRQSGQPSVTRARKSPYRSLQRFILGLHSQHPTPPPCVKCEMQVVVTRMLCFTQRIGGQYVAPVHFSFHPSSSISRRQPGQPSVTRARKSPYRSRQGFMVGLHSLHPTPCPFIKFEMEVVVTRMLCFTQRIGGQ